MIKLFDIKTFQIIKFYFFNENEFLDFKNEIFEEIFDRTNLDHTYLFTFKFGCD
jgi:hypothetical protein